MSVDTEPITKLVELVPDDALSTPQDTNLLRQRLTILLAAEITPIVQIEAWAISCLLNGMLGSAQVLRQILEQSGWGANFKLSDENAVFLNSLIEMQHEVWGNLAMMVRAGEMPAPPTPLTDPAEDKARQIVNARRWWNDAAGMASSLVNLDLMPAADVVKALPSLVGFEYAKQWLEGPYLLGYTLYVQQTMPHGARQSVDHGALVMLADTLAGAVIATHEKIRALRDDSKLGLIDRWATHLAWHMAVLRGFVVAAIEDRKMPLQHQLLSDTVVRGLVLLALQTVNNTPSTINWGGSANPVSMEVSSKAEGDLSKAFFDAIQKAAGSPLNQNPR